MQAIILAAGMGSRLKEITKNIPKALVPLCEDKTLLHTQLSLLETMGITKAVIVVGYKKDCIIETFAEQFGNIKIEYIYNEHYNTTNNIYSLYLAKDSVTEDTLLLECDLVLHPHALSPIMDISSPCCVVTSPFNPNTMDGSLIMANNKTINALILKKEQTSNFDYADAYKTVNIYRFSKDFFHGYLIPSMESVMDKYGVNNYYEAALKNLIKEYPDKFTMLELSEQMWYEIDNQTDLENAKKRITNWSQSL